MNFLLRRLNLENSFDVIRKRFIVPAIIAILTSASILYKVLSESESDLLVRMILTGVVSFFLSIGVKLYLETEAKKRKYLGETIILIYAIIFFISIHPKNDWSLESYTYFLLHLAGFITTIFFSPFLQEIFKIQVERIAYTDYFTKVSWSFLMSIIVGLSTLLLGFIAITSVVALFDLKDVINESKTYGTWATLALSLLAPLFLLTHIPEKRYTEKSHYETFVFFSFLIRYIAIPFIYIYFFILYTYTAKVLINFSDWPKGMISWLVIGFSVFGYITYIFSESYSDSNRLVSIFRRYFPIVVIPQIFMLAYAIGLRINQYDLTMNRYFVVTFGLWLLGISLYFNFSKKKSLVIITASLAIISLLISIGPWSVYSVPLERQYARLLKNLDTSGLYKDGKITKITNLDSKLQNDIYSGIEYICSYDECEKLKQLFPNEYKKAFDEAKKNWELSVYEGKEEYTGPTRWEITGAITTALGVGYSYGSDEGSINQYLNFTLKDGYNEGVIYPIDVEGYDRLVHIYSDMMSVNPVPDSYIFLDIGNEKISYFENKKKVTEMSVANFNSSLRSKYTNDQMYMEKNELITNLSNDNIDVKLILQSYSIPRDPTKIGNTDTYNGVSGFGLIHVKK